MENQGQYYVDSVKEGLSRTAGVQLSLSIDDLAQLTVNSGATAPVRVKQFVDYINKSRLSVLPMYDEQLDQYWVPAFPGELIIYNAMSSHGKSTLRKRHENAHNAFLKETDSSRTKYIISIDLEMYSQNLFAGQFLTGKITTDPKEIITHGLQYTDEMIAESMTMVNERIIRIAVPMGRPELFAQLTVKKLTELIEWITKNLFNREITISAIFFDYLQCLAESRGTMDKKMNEALMNDTNDIYNMASRFFCPVCLFTQATYEAYLKRPETLFIPGPYDIANSRYPHTRASKQWASWMPSRQHDIGSDIVHKFKDGKELTYHVTPELMFLQLQKQRPLFPGSYCIGNKRFMKNVDFQTGALNPVLPKVPVIQKNHKPDNIPSREQWRKMREGDGIPM